MVKKSTFLSMTTFRIGSINSYGQSLS